jgi:hypothetical protein
MYSLSTAPGTWHPSNSLILSKYLLYLSLSKPKNGIMKKFFLLASFALCSAMLFAQPTVQFPQNAPEIGDVTEIQHVSPNGLSPEPTGANVTWDYSELIPTYGGQIIAVSPSEAPSGAQFPSASVALNMGDTLFTFVLANTDGYFYLGSESTMGSYPSLLIYSDSRTFLKFPFTYGDTYFDTYEGILTTSMADLHVSAVTEMFADAYGTLILPDGTYTNVLRTLTVDEEIDSVFVAGNFIKAILVSRTQYSWFAPDSKGPLMSIEFCDKTGMMDTCAYYTAEGTGIVDDLKSPVSQLIVFPNPAEEHIMIEFDISRDVRATIAIVNQIGQMVVSRTVSDQLNGVIIERIDISSLPSGIYFVNVSCDCRKQLNEKFVIR